MRLLLTVVKGPTTYEAIRTVGTHTYDTYNEACHALGLLGDDKQYIEAIKEAFLWGSGHFLRKLFVTMLLSSSLNRPSHVWEETKKYLLDGILYAQQLLSNNRGMVNYKS